MQAALLAEALGLGPAVDQQLSLAEEQATRARDLQGVQDEILGLELADLRSGGRATPDDIALIEAAASAALAAGQTDIDRFERQAFETLREELAPGLGLRPTDSPIIDRGGEIAEEAIAQRGRLAATIRAAQLQEQLGFPLQRQQVSGGLNLAQGEQIRASQEFQQQLQQQAIRNRAALAGGAPSLAGTQTAIQGGLNLASAADPNISRVLGVLSANAPVTQTTSGSAGFSSILGGAGGFLSGLGRLFNPVPS